ncbi:MAG TPA: tetraacyldisaccharide 4'-kinase [Bacteroidales bacterium]|nr:tetraacyldisaccharide 4'-kinase [Bacteroidales bacterium]
MFDNRNILLYPLAVGYGIITGTRNFLYNTGILKSIEFDIPVICIGNITIGGTGKTPHTEYLAKLLSNDFKVAVLSRGYKRETSNFIIGQESSTVRDIGDEPLQMLKKLPGITIAVDKNRVNGINMIIRNRPGTEVIILDDGFQHRKLTAGLSILLIDFERPVNEDHMIPFGSLREYRHNIRRADIIIVTKTPPDLNPVQRRLDLDKIGRLSYQNVFFTSLKYKNPMPVFGNANLELEWNSFQGNGAVLVTGIANPKPLLRHLQRTFSEVKHLSYPDHYNFAASDIPAFGKALNELKTSDRYLITTEKDMIRLRELTDIPEELKKAFYYIPIGIEFLNDDNIQFDKQILDYVRKNKRNS